jgi:DNA-binding NarL/FixJ family response regulator
MITVVIIDDHPIVRAGMRTVLEKAGDIQVVAEGSSGAQALQLVAQHSPQVLVLDVNLPDLNGVEVTARLRQQNSATAVLILTVLNDQRTIFGLLENGATGYVLKDEALETLVNAVRAAAQGDTWLSPAAARQVVQRAFSKPAQPSDAPVHPDKLAELTHREIEILKLLALGLDNAAIARHLVVAMRTVQNHVSNIYGKLEVSSRTEAVLLAIRTGLVQVSDHDHAPNQE